MHDVLLTRTVLIGVVLHQTKLLVRTPDDGGTVPTWVVQGEADLVCPQVYAQNLVKAMAMVGLNPKSFFIKAGHRSTGDTMGEYLKQCMDEFTAHYDEKLAESRLCRSDELAAAHRDVEPRPDSDFPQEELRSSQLLVT